MSAIGAIKRTSIGKFNLLPGIVTFLGIGCFPEIVRKRGKKLTKEVHPDAMERFEPAVKVVVKSPPLHRVAKKDPKKAKTETTVLTIKHQA
jgi:hypothetical protein